MQVNSTGYAYSASSATNGTRKTGDQLGKDDFLQLLVTQLQHQDPLNPMDDKETIAQMAQFSALEQMQNLNTTAQMQQATSMVDKYVKAQVTFSDGSSELIYDRVTSVQLINGETYLALSSGKAIQMSNVQAVLGTDGLMQEAQALVGKRVYMEVTNSAGNSSLALVKIADVAKDDTGKITLKATDGSTYTMEQVYYVMPDEGGL